MKLIPYKENLCSRYAEKMISIKINSRCNRKCDFCVDWNGRNHKTINVLEIAEKAIKFNEYNTVIITGGEPFLDFDKVIHLATLLRPHKNRIVLNTNGTLLSSEKTAQLNGCIDELQVSIHHFDEEKNSKVFRGAIISFENIKHSLADRGFLLSINSCFHNGYTREERLIAIDKLVDLCNYLHADNLRLTELKKVTQSEFVAASEFFDKDSPVISFNSDELILKGCTYRFTKNGISVSIKRLCEYAKGKDAIAFSCCFIDANGQEKIDVETKDTFKVIYGDGLVTNDWIFNQITNTQP